MSAPVQVSLMRGLSQVVGWWSFGPAPDWEKVRRRVTAGTRFVTAPDGVTVTTGTLGGVPAEILTPRYAPTDSAILYLHGGGFVSGAPAMLRPLTGPLAAATGTTIYALDYRLAPEHPYPAAIDDVLAAYRSLLARGIPAERIAVAGDSAGGTLTLNLAERLRAKGWPQPALLTMICPVLDFTTGSSAFQGDSKREPLLTGALMRACVDAYLPGMPESERRALSPVHRDLTGLPPIVLQSAGDDLLAGDARRFAAHAAESGAPLRHREYRGLWHVFHAMPMKPAREAIADLAKPLTEALYGHHTGHRSGD
ncbi:alpha/beta hydrolase [Nocardia inohanensis]|uniref:alpha/beta hydrolase n=1 Tax=Nocardia inohanensis TaxID=209246 RepID=UPI000830E76D|nr:alpha/beta hydrolase [Nocardia inohanensis]